jgi:hypothetical protein
MDWSWSHPGAACAILLAAAAFAAGRLIARLGTATRPPTGDRDASPPLHLVYRRLRTLATAEDGAVAAEFALAAPILLALVLVAVQFALVAASRRAVEGAAFAAARSAVVWVPADHGEGANHLLLSGGSEKRERIERAAALVLLPVAPSSPPEDGTAAGREDTGPDVTGPLRDLARETGLADPDDVVRRYAAARARLRVAVRIADEPGRGAALLAGPSDPLTVRVTYACPLHVPLAARFLGVRDARTGGFQADLTATCTMRNEGTPERELVIGE